MIYKKTQMNLGMPRPPSKRLRTYPGYYDRLGTFDGINERCDELIYEGHGPANVMAFLFIVASVLANTTDNCVSVQEHIMNRHGRPPQLTRELLREGLALAVNEGISHAECEATFDILGFSLL